VVTIVGCYPVLQLFKAQAGLQFWIYTVVIGIKGKEMITTTDTCRNVSPLLQGRQEGTNVLLECVGLYTVVTNDHR